MISVDSPLPSHKTYQLRLRDLNGFLNCSMPLVFTFLCSINEEKTLTLDGTLGFHINLAREKGTISDVLDKAMKKDLTRNNPKEVND